MVTQEWETLEELQGIHIIDEDDVLDPSELYNKIEPYLDYDIYYAEDRVKQIKDNWDEELYTRCVSTDKFKSQQVKKTTSLLSENTPMTFHLDKLSDYILYAHYDNEEQEKEFHDAQEQFNKLKERHAKKKTDENKREELELSDKLKRKPRALSKKVYESRSHGTSEDVLSIDRFYEDNGDFDYASDISPRVNYTSVDKELNQKGHFINSKRYWLHFAPNTGNRVPIYQGETIPYANLAYDTLEQMEESIKLTENSISKVEWFVFLEEQVCKEQNIVTETFKSLSVQLRTLKNLKKDLRAEYNIAAESLRKIVTLKTSVHSASETISNDAWERMSLRDHDVYYALIVGYDELNSKYQDKINTTMWALLQDFENMLEEVNMDEVEREIMTILLSDGRKTAKEIQEELLLSINKEVPASTIHNTITKLVPNRLLEVYEQQLEDWVWIHRRKGTYKTCRKCNEIKLIKHFSVHKTYRDGYANICKNCESNRTRKYKTT